MGLSGQVAIKLYNDMSHARTQMRNVALIKEAPGKGAPEKGASRKGAPGEFKKALKRREKARQLRHTWNLST